jgi:RES domain-containing protein
VYTAESRALAVLELLVHLDPDDLLDFSIIGADVPDGLIEIVDAHAIDADWQSKPDSLRDFGEAWAKSHRSLALSVPSAVINAERNLILNPAHADFARVRIGVPEAFSLDARLRHAEP